ncbi:lytic murein transglycosylase [Candidatus Giovannonibacteria bacterium]|nr:lytic murein transglycosylase [Candidatus Giovannonibacteria bacterium]
MALKKRTKYFLGALMLIFFVSLAEMTPVSNFFNTLSALAQSSVNPVSVNQRRAQLEAELAQIEKEIANYQDSIKTKQAEARTLERDISILEAQIAKSKLEIKARNITIGNLQGSIEDKSKVIGELTDKIEKEKETLAELLRRLQELDQVSMLETVLVYRNLSDFFVQADSLNTLQSSIQNSVRKIKIDKAETEDVKKDLEERRAEELELKDIQVMEQKRIQQRESERKTILAETRRSEKEYQKVLTNKAKDAASIRSQLFMLNGSPAIPFAKALEYALTAEKSTGVRPAFLLGIITEESNLGANVGTGNWKEDLSHARCAKQRTAFQDITSRLGLNPDFVPVSKRAWYGYCGGAMGPAQFIPTTWLLYEDRIAAATGHNPPNPWDPRDAFVASALLLSDNGAASRTYKAEHTAALKYLAGSNWSKPAYRFYGDEVMAFASKYQDQIDLLSRYASR